MVQDPSGGDPTSAPPRESGSPSSSPIDELHVSQRLVRQLRGTFATAAVAHLQRRETLYSLGAVDNRLYLVECGRVKISVPTRCGKECLLSVHGPGELVGESCLGGSERMECAVAMVPSVVRQISRRQFVQVLLDSGLLEDYLGYIARRIAEQQQIIADFISQSSERRLASTLLRLARKLGTRQADRLYIDQKLTHEELAQMVGTTRSRIGFFLSNFRTEGLVDVTDDSLLMLNEARLNSYLDAS